MKLQGSQQIPPHQDRRLQLRMLGFVGLIGLAMFAVTAWRISSGKQGTSHPHYRQSPDEVSHDIIEHEPAPLKDDEIRIVPRQKKSVDEDADESSLTDSEIDIPPAWFADVNDNTVGIRKHEADTYYRILAKANSIPSRELQAHAVPDALYVNLMSFPEKYRGKPVTITGDLWKLYEFQAPDNDYGLTTLYEAWIFTADSGNHPYRVVCSRIPPEIKPPDSSRRAVKVTGYFFKREGYETPGARLHVAPTLLAGKLSLYISPQAPPPVENVVPWLVGVISVIGLAMLATVLGFAFSDSRGRRGRSTSNIDSVDIEQLTKADHQVSVEESLRRLEDRELEAEEAPIESSHNGNGHAHLADLPEEMVDLPTPFPPTRVPKRWDDPA